jgi:hypothetical protein
VRLILVCPSTEAKSTIFAVLRYQTPLDCSAAAMDHLSSFHPSDLLYTQEEIRRYRSGGFHLVRLDDTFKDGRYQVRHKLGWGGFSTVWLARDHVYVQT